MLCLPIFLDITETFLNLQWVATKPLASPLGSDIHATHVRLPKQLNQECFACNKDKKLNLWLTQHYCTRHSLVTGNSLTAQVSREVLNRPM